MAFWSKDKGEKDSAQDPSIFVGRKEYPKAIAAYRFQIAAQPNNYLLRHKVADVLCLAGKEKDSLADYSAAADGYAREGFLIKAIAILKKMQKLDPPNASVEARLAQLAAAGSSSARAIASSPAESSPDIGAGSGGEDLSLDMEALDDQPSIPLASMDGGALTARNLAETPLFSDLDADELKGVVGRLRHHAFAAGSVLVHEGDPGDSLFVLSEGRVKVTTLGPKGGPVHLADLKEGDFFGEVSLLTGKPRTATITSLEGAEVLELTRSDLEDLEGKHPRIRDVIREFYERRVASTIEAMVQAVRRPKPPGAG
jgi:cAMP-dependent protein kinase regulator